MGHQRQTGRLSKTDRPPPRGEAARRRTEAGTPLLPGEASTYAARESEGQSRRPDRVTAMAAKQLADAARAVHPELPIILTTGYGGSALVNVNMLKEVEILRKPFSLEELTSRITTLLMRAK
jgi:hypothetical protein